MTAAAPESTTVEAHGDPAADAPTPGSTREEIEREHMQSGKAAFARHVIVWCDARGWDLGPPRGEPWTGMGIVHVSVSGGYVLVAGDTNTCVFGSRDATDARGQIAWAARIHLCDLGDRAVRGMNCDEAAFDSHPDVARRDLHRRLASLRKDLTGDEEEDIFYQGCIDAVEEALDAIDEYESALPAREVLRDAEDTTGERCFSDAEEWATLGRVTAHSVLFCHAAVQRLDELLRAEEAEAAARAPAPSESIEAAAKAPARNAACLPERSEFTTWPHDRRASLVRTLKPPTRAESLIGMLVLGHTDAVYDELLEFEKGRHP